MRAVKCHRAGGRRPVPLRGVAFEQAHRPRSEDRAGSEEGECPAPASSVTDESDEEDREDGQREAGCELHRQGSSDIARVNRLRDDGDDAGRLTPYAARLALRLVLNTSPSNAAIHAHIVYYSHMCPK